MTWPALVLWAMIAGGLLMRGPLALFYLFYACGAIGTLVMVPGNVVGGINLLPQSFCALFLLAKVLFRPDTPRACCFSPFTSARTRVSLSVPDLEPFYSLRYAASFCGTRRRNSD